MLINKLPIIYCHNNCIFTSTQRGSKCMAKFYLEGSKCLATGGVKMIWRSMLWRGQNAWRSTYLESTGIIVETVTPTSVIKAAFAAKIIENGEIWMQALDSRNKMSHTYNIKVFEQIISDIDKHYLGILESMYLKLYQIKIERVGK